MESESSAAESPQGPHVEVTCPFCQASLSVPASQGGQSASCPQCQGTFQVPLATAQTAPVVPPFAQVPGAPPYQEFIDKKLPAGICGIVLGGLGIHKFILGMNNPAIIMLAVSLAGVFLGSCLVIPIFATMAMGVIGRIEGILYLTKSDEDFYRTYALEKKEWL